jgi:hypothetical protein
VVAVVNGNDDLVLFADVVSFQGPGDHLLGFGKSGFGEEGVENFVFFANFIGFFIDHFQVGVDNFVIEPESKGKVLIWQGVFIVF